MGIFADIVSLFARDYATGGSSEDMVKMMKDQYAFSSKNQANRENQRNFAMGKWRDLLGSQQKYETPGSVGKYVDLMFDLGGELSQIRDPSNKTNIDYNKYKSGIKEYDQLTAGDMSGLDKYLKEIEYTQSNNGGGIDPRNPLHNPNSPPSHPPGYQTSIEPRDPFHRPNSRPPASTSANIHMSSPGDMAPGESGNWGPGGNPYARRK